MNSEQYCQRADLTREEQAELYMKLPKEKLVEMLIECNRVIDEFTCRKTHPEPWPEVKYKRTVSSTGYTPYDLNRGGIGYKSKTPYDLNRETIIKKP